MSPLTNKISCIYVVEVSMLRLVIICLLDFGTFPTVWYASLFCHRTTCVNLENVVYNIIFSFFVNYFVFQSVEERQMRISNIKD